MVIDKRIFTEGHEEDEGGKVMPLKSVALKSSLFF